MDSFLIVIKRKSISEQNKLAPAKTAPPKAKKRLRTVAELYAPDQLAGYSGSPLKPLPQTVEATHKGNAIHKT